jgi:LAO/AO transport system kinase
MMSIKKKFKEEKDLERFEAELKDIVLNNINEKIEEMMQTNKTFTNYLKKINSKKIDPYSAADKISKSIMK